jgi:hypothetical protein
MAAYNKFDTFVLELGEGTHQLQAGGHELKIYLSNAVPNAGADSVKADLAEIAAANGYPAGGSDAQNDYTEAGGVGTLTCVDIVFTAGGGSFGPLRYAVLYNEDAPNDELISWWDYGSSITVLDGETFTIDFGASVFTIT